MKNGYGIYQWAKGGRIYQGNWMKNTISGYGEYKYNDGRVYYGYLLNNLRHG